MMDAERGGGGGEGGRGITTVPIEAGTIFSPGD